MLKISRVRTYVRLAESNTVHSVHNPCAFLLFV